MSDSRQDDRPCRNCEHTQALHPHEFLCGVEDCRCPGYFAVRHPDREDLK